MAAKASNPLNEWIHAYNILKQNKATISSVIMAKATFIATGFMEFLRNIYAASGLSMRPKLKMTQIEMLKEIIRALGGDPEKAMLEQAFLKPHRTFAG